MAPFDFVLVFVSPCGNKSETEVKQTFQDTNKLTNKYIVTFIFGRRYRRIVSCISPPCDIAGMRRRYFADIAANAGVKLLMRVFFLSLLACQLAIAKYVLQQTSHALYPNTDMEIVLGIKVSPVERHRIFMATHVPMPACLLWDASLPNAGQWNDVLGHQAQRWGYAWTVTDASTVEVFRERLGRYMDADKITEVVAGWVEWPTI